MRFQLVSLVCVLGLVSLSVLAGELKSRYPDHLDKARHLCSKSTTGAPAAANDSIRAAGLLSLADGTCWRLGILQDRHRRLNSAASIARAPRHRTLHGLIHDADSIAEVLPGFCGVPVREAEGNSRDAVERWDKSGLKGLLREYVDLTERICDELERYE